ncbi:MAG: terminase small subunit [FCB group bacterium]|nr:terminase small subunit [FCB group bacterium]
MKSLTLKQETFCHSYIETGNACEAYRRSYDTENMKAETIKRRAAELVEHSTIRATIDNLQDEYREQNKYTVERLAGMYQRAYDCSIVEGQLSVAVQATRGLSRLFGLEQKKPIVESQEIIVRWGG